MWVKCLNTNQERLLLAGMDDAVEIPDSGVVQVTQEIGEQLLERDDYEHHEKEAVGEGGGDDG